MTEPQQRAPEVAEDGERSPDAATPGPFTSGEISARNRGASAPPQEVPAQAEPVPPPRPWAYRPQEMDDWGGIRDAEGATVAHIRSPYIDVHGDAANEHRRAGTDPYGQTARLIVSAVNAHDDLAAALKALEAAEDAHANCPECDGEGVPELCERCFPLFDDARVLRRAALAKAEDGARNV